MKKETIKKVLIAIVIMLTIICIGSIAYAAGTYILGSGDVYYIKSNNTKVSVEAALNELYAKANTSTRIIYHAGDVVRFGGEDFQVLNDVIEGQLTCELFCKTDLNDEGTQQINLENSDRVVTNISNFSSEYYWQNNWTSGTRLNLNNESGYAPTDAIGIAKSYAKLKGALDGRLLTYDEAISLKYSTNSNINNMFKGTGNTARNYESYWLASTGENNYNSIYYVYGKGNSVSCYNWTMYYTDYVRVRPILTVLVSQIQ